MPKLLTKRESKRISVPRICILGMFLALLVTLKYAFGFVPGIEVVSFLFIIFGMFLPLLDLSLMIVCFNLLIIVIYGFGNWWFAYWVIWPVDAFLSKGLTKVTRNRFVFALFGFLVGASVGFWYFFSDLIFFGKSFAILNIITAIPINVIEGFTTMLMIILVAPLLTKVMGQYSMKFWENPKPFSFKQVKHPKISMFLTIFLAVGSLGGITTLFVFNHSFIEWKQRESKTSTGHIDFDHDSGLGAGKATLSATGYNNFYDTLNDGQVGIAVIANGKIYEEKVDIHKGETIEDAMKDGKNLEFKFHSGTQFGSWVKTFRPIGTQNWLHGTATTKNYGDYYPVYFINHRFAPLGVSNWKVSSKEIYEITYDHNA